MKRDNLERRHEQKHKPHEQEGKHLVFEALLFRFQALKLSFRHGGVLRQSLRKTLNGRAERNSGREQKSHRLRFSSYQGRCEDILGVGQKAGHTQGEEKAVKSYSKPMMNSERQISRCAFRRRA